MSPHRGFSADFWIASLHKLHSEEIATTWPSLALCGGTPMGCLPQSCDCTLSRLTAQGLYSGTWGTICSSFLHAISVLSGGGREANIPPKKAGPTICTHDWQRDSFPGWQQIWACPVCLSPDSHGCAAGTQEECWETASRVVFFYFKIYLEEKKCLRVANKLYWSNKRRGHLIYKSGIIFENHNNLKLW